VTFLQRHAFVILTLTLNIGASVRYLCAGDYGRACYWLLAAGLTTTLTFWVGR